MKRKDRKLNEAMREKVTPAQFFLTQVKIIKELYSEYRFQTVAIIAISCITSVGTSVVELKFLEYATNSVSDYVSGKSPVTVANIVFMFSMFLAALFVMRVLSAFYEVISQKYKSNISFRAEKKIVYRLSEISYELYESREFHDKINLARQASSQYTNAVYGVTQIFNILVMLAVYAVMLSRLNPLFLAVVFISIIINIVLSSRVTDKQLDYYRMHVSPVSRKTGYLAGILNNRVNHQNIQITRSINYFLNRYSRNNREMRNNYLKLNMLSFVSEIAVTLLFMATFAITALYVGKGVVHGKYEIGYFTMTIALLFNLFSYLKQFSMFLNNGNWYIKVMGAYYEILDFRIEKENAVTAFTNDTSSTAGKSTDSSADNGDNNESNGPTGPIILENIIYKYPQSDKYALRGIDAVFHPGEKIAVVGVNGSGKTTLMSVILSLLKNYEGVYFGKSIPKTAILQDFCQYQMTIKQNIEIGCGGRKLADEKVNDILSKVGLLDFVSQLPEGINTMLGQLNNGIELSKGQWQRLVIGRLLANEGAKVWILDEPTAYLDPLAEVEMYKQIWQLSGDRLVFFISHRLGFAKNADRIIVVDNGRIMECGVHEELLKKNGIYAKMFLAQKEWYE